MKILFDTNVVLDVLLDRRPQAALGARLFVAVEQRRIDGILCATTVTTIHYLARKARGFSLARKSILQLLSLFEVAPVDRKVLVDALSLSFDDFEDAVVHEAARHAGAGAIVTRDPKGFSRSKVRIFEPAELLGMLESLPPA